MPSIQIFVRAAIHQLYVSLRSKMRHDHTIRLLLLTAILLVCSAQAQTTSFDIYTIKLPEAIAYYDNQFSGLQVSGKKLYLLSECRIQDKREAVIYTIPLPELDRAVKDTTYQPSFEKIMIYGLDTLAAIMKQANQEYEGLEAFVIKDDMVYLSVETNTPSPLAYILKGRLKDNTIYLSTTFLPVAKPLQPDDSHIYNASFESMMLFRKKLMLFFEYNSFAGNYVYITNPSLLTGIIDSRPMQELPFRITDITPSGKNSFTALNVFYKGEGGDTIYRVSGEDSSNNMLIKKNGVYEDYSRLITLQYNKRGFTWKSLWEFPVEYRGYNWEGIAKYKNGYFVINDKYTRRR
ncbi:MAG: hypothetical protein J0I84_20515, partial [Terrimonas sp.]|nr:hypothetical protein [Terrimonas sp.]